MDGFINHQVISRKK